MTFVKAKPGVVGAKDYLGNSDGPAKGPRPGTDEFIRQMIKVSLNAMFNLGSYGQRDMKGKPGTLSVHATGRAVDLGFSKSDKHPEANRARAMAAVKLVLEHANEFGIQACYDYWPLPWGRGWRCDRQTWENYTVKTISGAPRGQWFHFELEPRMADDPAAVKAVFNKVFYQSTK